MYEATRGESRGPLGASASRPSPVVTMEATPNRGSRGNRVFSPPGHLTSIQPATRTYAKRPMARSTPHSKDSPGADFRRCPVLYCSTSSRNHGGEEEKARCSACSVWTRSSISETHGAAGRAGRGWRLPGTPRRLRGIYSTFSESGRKIRRNRFLRFPFRSNEPTGDAAVNMPTFSDVSCAFGSEIKVVRRPMRFRRVRSVHSSAH